jgi:hypothetical protein
MLCEIEGVKFRKGGISHMLLRSRLFLSACSDAARAKMVRLGGRLDFSIASSSTSRPALSDTQKD